MGVHLRGRALIEGWRGGKKLLAIYRGDRLIWDGRVSQYLAMPSVRAQSAVPQVALTQTAVLDMPILEGWASMTGDGAVTGSSAVASQVATASAKTHSPDLVVSSTLEAPTVVSDGAASQVAEAVSRQEALLFVPRAAASAVALAPSLVVSSTLEAPTVSSGGEAKAGTYFVSAILAAETAIVYPPTVAETPAMSSWHRISVSGPALSGVSALIPSVSSGHVIGVPTVSGTASTKTPAVSVAATFTRQRMVKSGTYSASGSRAIVPGWTSDSTYPATLTGNKLVVQGGGDATIATQGLSPNGNGGGGNWSRIYLMHNGTAIATYEQNGSGGWSCPNWSIPRTVAAGDTIWIETQFDPFGAVTIVNNSFVEVIPT